VGNSPTDFGSPAATVTFTKDRKVQSARCGKPTRGRYVKVRVLSEVNGEAWGSAADIGVIGKPAK
jgi:hypothetical protein